MQQLGLSPDSSRKSESRLRSFLWPDLTVLPEIETTIYFGKLAAITVGLVSLLMILVQRSMAPLLDSLLFLGLGFGMGRRSRTCAVLVFAVYLLGRLVIIAGMNSPSIVLGLSRLVLPVALTIIFLNAMRATFAYHAHKRQAQKGDMAVRAGD